jgi:carbon monoxide dehydrogenase subunit G
MEFSGRYSIPAAPETVWAAINDPEVLRACIPGCKSVIKIDDSHFEAAVKLKIGPVSATFKGKIALEELAPPNHCVLRGEGQGGVAGFAKGEAAISLAPEAAGTLLSYQAKANIGGKLAQIGQRLIDGAARQIADDFFENFSAAVNAGAEAAADEASLHAQAISLAASEAAGVPMEPIASEAVIHDAAKGDGGYAGSKRGGATPEIWVIGLIGIIVILLILFGVVL